MAICHRRRKCKPEILYFRSWCLGESHLYVCAMPTNGSRRKMFLRGGGNITRSTRAWHDREREIGGRANSNCTMDMDVTGLRRDICCAVCSCHARQYLALDLFSGWFNWSCASRTFFAHCNAYRHSNVTCIRCSVQQLLWKRFADKINTLQCLLRCVICDLVVSVIFELMQFFRFHKFPRIHKKKVHAAVISIK